MEQEQEQEQEEGMAKWIARKCPMGIFARSMLRQGMERKCPICIFVWAANVVCRQWGILPY